MKSDILPTSLGGQFVPLEAIEHLKVEAEKRVGSTLFSLPNARHH